MAKNKNPYSVEKELSPEDKTGLSNLIAIAQEILESGETGEEMHDPTTQKAEKPEVDGEEKSKAEGEEDRADEPEVKKLRKDQYSDEEDDKKKPEEGNKNEIAKALAVLRKAIESTAPGTIDGETDAEERVEGEPNEEMSQDALAEVAKMLLGMRQRTVKKTRVNPTIAAMTELAKSIKAMNERQTIIAKSVSKIMDITGITEQFKVSKAAAEQKKTPVAAMDTEVMKSAFAEMLGIKKPLQSYTGVAKSKNEMVADELGSLLSGMGKFRR